MTTYFKKNDAGEFVEADDDVDALFRQKSEKIIRSKLEGARDKFKSEIRDEIENEVRESATETIKTELRNEIETEWKPKLEASESKAKELDIKLRRKTIAAEYGFKPDAEQFLGDGSDDEMRAKADTLKNSFVSGNNSMSIEKSSEPTVSKLQQKTGITVEI